MKSKITALFLCGAFFLAGCAAGGISERSVMPTEVKVAEDSVTPEDTAALSPMPTPELKTLLGMIVEIGESSFVLKEKSSGETLSFLFGDGLDRAVTHSVHSAETAAAESLPSVRTIEAGDVVETLYFESAGERIAAQIELKEKAPDPPFNLYEDRAEEIMREMTVEEKVGQLFFVRCPETAAAETAAEYHPAGYILFDRDFKDKTKQEVRAAVDRYQQAADIGMLIGVDEEGGTVKRVGKYEQLCGETFLSPQELYAQGGTEAVLEDTARKSEILLELGINVNLAPVCDVSTSPDDFIYERTLGKDAVETAEYTAAVVEQMNKSSIGCTLKHFPGYGSNEDTHTGIAQDTRPYDEFAENDFLPFEAGIAQNAGSVLVCHNIVECMDGNRPASLSPEVHEVLRDDLGFSGVIMTDDLYMDAIRSEYGTGEAAVLAVQAGNDLVLSSQFEAQYDAVLEAVKNGTLTQERIDESVRRVLCWKLSLGIID